MIRDDIKLASRSLYRSPMFAMFAVMCIAVGVSASTLVGSLLRATAWRPIPFANAERLLAVYATTDARIHDSFDAFSWAEFTNWANNHPVGIDGLAAYSASALQLKDAGNTSAVSVARVTENFFEVLDRSLVKGPGFSRESLTGGEGIVVSDRFWTAHGAARQAVGSVVDIGGRSRTVVGTIPSSAAFPPGTDVWIAVGPKSIGEDATSRSMVGIARLRSTSTPEAAERQLTQLQERLVQSQALSEYRGAAVRPFRDTYRAGSTSWAWMVAAVVACVLVLGCATLANLMLIRLSSRHHEIAVRLALGASKVRVGRQLLVEATILAILGGSLGVAVVMAGTPAFIALLAARDGTLVDLQFDGMTAVVGIVGIAATVIVFGIVSLLGIDDAAAGRLLRTSGNNGGKRTRLGIRDFIVAFEIAMAVLLGTAAITLSRSAAVLTASDSGMRTADVSVARIDVSAELARDTTQTTRVASQLQDRIASVAGGRVALWSARGPRMRRDPGGAYMRLPGRDTLPLKAVPFMSYDISGDLFGALGIRIRRGRGFTPHDDMSSPQVAVINERAAELLWPNGDPIGRTFSLGAYPSAGPITVVGVVSNTELIREGGSRFNFVIRDKHFPLLFRPLAQAERLGDPGTQGAQLYVALPRETRWSPRELSQLVRGTHPSLSLARVSSYDQFRTNKQLEVSTKVVASTGFVALGLALLGVLAVVQECARRRTPELCLRLALGAQPRHIAASVLARALGLLGVGVSAGVYLPILFSGGFQRIFYGITEHNAQGILFGVSAIDLKVTILVSASISAIVMTGTLVPLIRALRLDPASAIRDL